MTNYEEQSKEDLLDLYNRAKEAYYGTEHPIMSDAEFDELEQYLVDNHDLQKHIGQRQEVGEKVKHINRMLSLGKVKINTLKIEQEHLDAIQKHLGITGTYKSPIRFSLKYDGLAMNVTYVDHRLQTIVTRGNGERGVDVTRKFWHKVPETIALSGTIEIRVEACISKANFEKHYAKQYSHPRNLASGIKGDQDPNDPRLKHMDLIAVDAINSEGIVIPLVHLEHGATGFKLAVYEQLHTSEELMDAYNEWYNDRSTFDYPNDGIVVFRNRYEMRKHNNHDPEDAIAIKFPPETFVTTVKDIHWALSKHGKYIPVVLLEPIKIDGRMIGRVSGHNYGNIAAHGISKGAKIEIAILGDIIPGIKSVIQRSDVELTLPEDAEIDGVHLRATASADKVHMIRFIHGFLSLGFDNVGPTAASDIWRGLYEDHGSNTNFAYSEVFSPAFDEHYMITIGLGPATAKTISTRLAAIKKDGIKLKQVVQSLGLTGLGNSMSTQIARYLSNLPHDFSGLEKRVVESAMNGDYHLKITRLTSSLQLLGVTVHNEVENVAIENAIKYVMTGSPKPHFKTKVEFSNSLPHNYVETGNLKEAQILFTDDLNSTSSKMQTAKKLNITIKTYVA